MEKTLMVLDKINTPEDLRGLSAEGNEPAVC